MNTETGWNSREHYHVSTPLILEIFEKAADDHARLSQSRVENPLSYAVRKARNG